ncbi:hypothetical protein KUC3_22650 [Alteromonas sp. KC3]|uniref:hypothetical protein n=1 Tax=unclassified Alteromonas TaxID=2614992 RepID=UPI0019203E5D|nr:MULTISPECIES: hypothetical protein [unclassified Alteromonas]BCO19408.1 hypothetical protein KUC3_22650 [Alteromonas sp. KC3]BCO23370.1 hypothetical protein KUC14_22390 [Alteromonas sp. KC14]
MNTQALTLRALTKAISATSSIKVNEQDGTIEVEKTPIEKVGIATRHSLFGVRRTVNASLTYSF